MPFEPDYRHFIDVMANRRPARMPIYEHLINVGSMEKILHTSFAPPTENKREKRRFFEQYCGFYRDMGYDTVSFEVCVNGILPGGGALQGEHPGVIQNRTDFDAYPWEDLPRIFRERAYPQFQTLHDVLPPGMKAVGGVGNGVFEISEDLVGFEQLCYLQADDPQLFADLYVRIGDLLVTLWTDFLQHFADDYVVCRIGDDLGYKTGTLLAPNTVRNHIIPQYARITSVIHSADKPYLQHSCGCIFEVMDDWIAAGIDAKHSNEDEIAPFEVWIDRYADRIALCGGIDTDRLCRMQPQAIFDFVREKGTQYRNMANGYALGSGNSIPEYVPREGYLAMIEAAKAIRQDEAAG